MPGVRTDSGTRPPESGRHGGGRLGVVSRIGTRCGGAHRTRRSGCVEEEVPNVDECHRGSPVGSRLPRACRKTCACDGAYQQLRGRHRARLRRAQGPAGPAVRRGERGDGDGGRDRRARCARSQGVWAHRQRSRRRRAVRQDGDAGLRRPRRGHQPGAAGNAGRQSDCHAGGRGAAGCHATHPAVPDFQDRRQPHEHGLERGPDPQRRHARPQGQGTGPGLRCGRQGGADGHDARPGRGMGRPRRALQCDCARAGPGAGGQACPASPILPPWRSTWPRGAAGSCQATCSKPRSPTQALYAAERYPRFVRTMCVAAGVGTCSVQR